jgi:hypothetical protein
VPRIGPSLLALSLLTLAAAPAWAHGPREAGLALPSGETTIEAVSVSPAPMRPADSPARLEGGQGGVPAGRVGADLAAATGLLIVALGLAGFGRSWQREPRVAIAALSAGLLLGFIVETAPHLVHHVLDADKGAGCQVLQAAERSHAAVGTLDVTPAPVLAGLTDVRATLFAPALPAPAPCGRAPPV